MASVEMDANLGIKVKYYTTAGTGTATFDTLIQEYMDINGGTSLPSQANLCYSATRTLAASGTENLDLSGALNDVFGATIVAAQVVAVYIKANSANTNNVVVGGATSNAFNGPLSASGTYTLKPGEYLFWGGSNKGWTVTAGTGDLLKVANSAAGTPVTYSILVIARTTAV